MSIAIVYTCDTCKESNTKQVYYGVKLFSRHEFMHETLGPEEAVFCSMECLGKALEWAAEKYNKDNNGTG